MRLVGNWGAGIRTGDFKRATSREGSGPGTAFVRSKAAYSMEYFEPYNHLLGQGYPDSGRRRASIRAEFRSRYKRGAGRPCDPRTDGSCRTDVGSYVFVGKRIVVRSLGSKLRPSSAARLIGLVSTMPKTAQCGSVVGSPQRHWVGPYE